MLGDGRRHLGQLDALGHAHDLGGKILMQGAAAARAAIWTMIDDGIGIPAHHAAMALVPGLGTARLGLLASLLAVGRGRLRRRARGIEGRCNRSTSSISSSRLSRSRSLRPIPRRN